MNKVPRASLSITILGDEDYRVLMASRAGLEAFAVFVAVLLVGRERLQQGQARQLSGTESLRIDNSLTHVIALAHVTRRQLDKAVSVLGDVARETGGKPWMYVDESQHIVIRSFFKFNTSKEWGGRRGGAGRRPTRNQDDSEKNQDDSETESSRKVSVSDSVSVSVSDSVPVSPDGLAPGPDAGSHQECVELAMDLFGDQAANAVARKRADLGAFLAGADGRPRWDCFAAALAEVDRRSRKPGARKVDDVIAYSRTLAAEWVVVGIPPAPVAVEPRPPAGPSLDGEREKARRMMERIKAREAANG